MEQILKIDSSAQLECRSITRKLTGLFVSEFLKTAPQTKIIHRDVGRDPIPAIDHHFIHAAFTPAESREPWMTERLALSDELIDELDAADIIVLGVPMYNYGMPAALKGWIDHVARIGRTFSFDLSRGDFPIEPVLSGKKLIVISSRGEFGFEPGGPRGHFNALDPAIAACAPYWGVEETSTVVSEYQEFKDDRHVESVAAAEQIIREISEKWGRSADVGPCETTGMACG